MSDTRSAEVEPDPRFTLANERTYLAWVRTALALIAAGVALDTLATNLDDQWRRLAAAVLVLFGVLSALTAHHRWRRIQLAMRRGHALPTMKASLAAGYAIATVGVLLLIFT